MNFRFTGTLTKSDVHRHIPHAFDVPKGTTEVRMKFQYSPRLSTGQEYPNQMSLSLRDPAGPRGVSYVVRENGMKINENNPTPGFEAGPVRPGTWVVDVDTYRLLGPDPIQYVIDIELTQDPIMEPVRVFEKPTIASRGAGWYRGDLHAHSVHSDAKWDVSELVDFARSRQLDFASLTDHNTVSGLPEHVSLGDDELLTMGGLELSTFYGHAVVLGTRSWFEWRLDTPDRYSMRQLAKMVHDSGAFFIIAHPMRPGDPVCSGCRWEFQDMRPGSAPAIEVWNGPWSTYNQQSLELFYQWLNAGHKLVATAGTDLHGHPGALASQFGSNVVYSEDLTEAAILQALRLGRSYLSAGPELLLSGSASPGSDTINGGTLPNNLATIDVAWAGAAEGDVLRFIADGRLHDERQIGESGSACWTLDGAAYRWCNAELRDSQDRMRALANPIYFGDCGPQ